MEFEAKWISDGIMADIDPREVFHRERDGGRIENDVTYGNAHILFRKKIVLDKKVEKAVLRISADDCYKLYINGKFVNQGPAPSYHFAYGYDEIDVSALLNKGENCFAVHTYYQGLINRVWQSGDRRHGLICELEADGQTVMTSDGSFLTHRHGAYSPAGVAGYDTQFLENYDSRAPEAGFEAPDFDDSGWEHAHVRKTDDHMMKKRFRGTLAFEKILPVKTERLGNRVSVDFGGCYVGYLCAAAEGASGEKVHIRCGEELGKDGRVRYKMRCNCTYSEEWTLSGGTDKLCQFDYKTLRFAEFEAEENAQIKDVYLFARHRPFTLCASVRPEYSGDADIARIWELCVRSQHYGVQETVLDCTEREKGTYLGDGCYTSLANTVLTGNDDLMRSLIDGAFESKVISRTLMSCLYCSHMQEIAEYPLLLVQLALWHFRLTGDRAFLEKNTERCEELLEEYRKFEKDGLLYDTKQWCVTEWPANYRDGYAVTNDGNKPYSEPHVVLNSYYINAVRALNKMRVASDKKPYRDAEILLDTFESEFYDKESKRFFDSKRSGHISYIGNIFPYAYGLCRDADFYGSMTKLIKERGITGTSLFASFPLLTGLERCGERELLRAMITDERAWLRMIREGATATFECWGADEKWNTSLFHLLNSYISVFIADTDLSVLPV